MKIFVAVTRLDECHGLRYKAVRKHKSYGKLVYEHLQRVKSKLLEEPPRRSQLLRLVKDLADLVNMMEKTKIEPATTATKEEP